MTVGFLFNNHSNSKWNADQKIDKQQHRRDILGFRTSARPNHAAQRQAELARVQARKDKKAEEGKSDWACLPIAVAMVGGLLATLSGLVYGAAKVIG